MGGHTNMMMVSVSLALPLHREGKVKMLSIGSAKRLPQLPEFPTTAESGNLPGYTAGTWFGLAVTRRNATADRRQDQRRRARASSPSPRSRSGSWTGSSPRRWTAHRKSSGTTSAPRRQTWARVIREQNLVIGAQ